MPTLVVKLYLLPGQEQSQKVEAAFRSHGIDPVVIDLAAFPPAIEYLEALGYTRAPVTIIFSPVTGAAIAHWEDFDPERIRYISALTNPSHRSAGHDPTGRA